MGKGKNEKRVTLQKQIIIYYIHVLTFTMVTSFFLILTTYFIFHSIVGFHSLDLKGANIIEIIEYSNENSSLIISGEFKEELNRITNKYSLGYYIKDTENRVLYGSKTKNASTEHNGFLMNMIHEILSNSISTSSVDIPIIDKRTGKVSQILVLMQNSFTYMTLFILVDICIPFVCLIAYTLIFSRNLSRDIKKPLDELMIAVEKIKARDLEFSISNNRENEIGDLARAFEEMRVNFKDSLLREWQLEQDRREMVATITHDLRTPLAIIQGHIEGLKDGLKKETDKLDFYLDIIEQNSLRAKRLIDEMNSLVEIDSFGFELSLKDEDIIEFLREKIGEMKVLAENKMINIEPEIYDCRNINKLISIDSGRISQVINNFAGNSMRFTPQGGTIRFHAKIEENMVSFRICDSGQGFSEKDLNNVFKKFYKGDSSRSKEKGHSGLGLYIARTIIEKHGGAIKASNLPNGGACLDFFITYGN